MNTLLCSFILCCFVASVWGFNFNDDDHIQKINQQAKTWKAGKNKCWDSHSEADVKALLGWNGRNESLRLKKGEIRHKVDALPVSFDSREKWSNCQSIKKINNQAKCGSCWAFGAIESVTDRFCIASGQKTDIQLSFQDLVSCSWMDNGCEGGAAENAMEFLEWDGVVSAACSPYTVPTCPPEKQPCLNFVPTPPCVEHCVNSSISWDSTKHYLKTWHAVSSDIDSIATEIMQSGPVEACFSVYSDFPSYKSGVYQVASNATYLGGHCVKIIGWGVENSEKYWLVANSWTTYWGDKGFFKILRGVNECGIEGDIVAGVPE